MGLRRQALLEYRTAVELQPSLFSATTNELFVEGASPQELAAVASIQAGHMLDLVTFLSARSRLADAFVVLDQADAIGAPRAQSLPVRAALQLKAGQVAAADATVETARAAGIQDPRLAVLGAQLLTTKLGADGADQALAILDLGASRYPTDLGVQRARIDLVRQYKKWQAANRALEGLKLALYHAQGSATEAYIASARIQGELGRWRRAIDDYRIALADQPNDASLWIEYAHAAEAIGRDGAAREGYAQAARLSPNRQDLVRPLQDAEAREARLRALVGEAAPRPAKDGESLAKDRESPTRD
jgi:tetratricopeptide (TPR) repeat protein